MTRVYKEGFFEKVVLGLCGSRDIHMVLNQLLSELKSKMPVSQLYLAYSRKYAETLARRDNWFVLVSDGTNPELHYAPPSKQLLHWFSEQRKPFISRPRHAENSSVY